MGEIDDVVEPQQMTPAQRLLWLENMESDAEFGVEIESWLRELDQMFVVMAIKVLRPHRADRWMYQDDAEQEARIAFHRETLKRRQKRLAGQYLEPIQNPLAFMQTVCTAAINSWANSPRGLFAMSNTSGQHARSAEAAKVRNRLEAELGREPTTEEVVEAANRDIAERVKDPVKQGKHLTAENIQAPVVQSMDAWTSEPDLVGADDSGCAVTAPELYAALTETVERACKKTEGDRMRAIAQEFALAAVEGELLPAAEIARRLGINESTTRAYRRTLIDTLREVLLERFAVVGTYQVLASSDLGEVLDEPDVDEREAQ